MNRSDLQDLSNIRLREARALFRDKKYDGAYYLCGYAIECALKACIAKNTQIYDFPPNPQIINKIYTHDFVKLIQAAGLSDYLETEKNSNPQFKIMWKTVTDWSESSRYKKHRRVKVNDLYKSIVNRNNGVLRWLKQYW